METRYIAERARYLRLASLSVSEGLRFGGFRSAFRGQGMEFDSVREYQRGDDIRSIDRNVTARTGTPHVKLYREERELTVFLVVDLSLSMSCPEASGSKRQTALDVAGLLAFACEHDASPLGSVVFDAKTGRVFRPRTGADHVLSVLASLENHQTTEGGSALSAALSGACRILRNKSLVVVISDFRATDYDKPLGLLARRHDVIACRIVSPFDGLLPSAGVLPFRDSESNLIVELPTSSSSFRAEWTRSQEERLSRWEQTCKRRGAFPLVLSTSGDPLRSLCAFFSGVRR